MKNAVDMKWHIGFYDRGHGHGDWAITLANGRVVAECNAVFQRQEPPLGACISGGLEIAQHIVDFHNAQLLIFSRRKGNSHG